MPGGTEPVRLRLFSSRPDFTPEELVYTYTDYTGKPVASGQAKYLSGNGGMLEVPPPREVGYYDLLFPALGIHSAVVAARRRIFRRGCGGQPRRDAALRA